MRLTFATDETTYSVDVDQDMELGDIMALLEAESGIAIGDQALFLGTRQLSDPKTTLEAYGIKEDDVLLLRHSRSPSTSSSSPNASSNPTSSSNSFTPAAVASGPPQDAAELARQQMISNSDLMAQLRDAEPEIADAALNDPAKFRRLYEQRGERYRQMQEEKRQMEQLLMADPFDVAAQAKIEEAIRQERVLENMEHAMEFSPESFGRVTMLYVDVEVNGHPLKAFVDSGAQATIISPECAERCGIMRLLDTRFRGIARGVGTAKILGRIHSAQIKIGSDLFLPCTFTVMEGRGVELLFGLDMLKRYQASIDLHANALIIQGRSVRFLAEHELPMNGLEEEVEVDENGNLKVPESIGGGKSAAMGAAAAANARSHTAGGSAGGQGMFPGSGNTLSTPGSGNANSHRNQQQHPQSQQQGSSKWPEASIAALTAMGVSRDEAIRLLDAADGNVDVAANLMF